MLTNKLKRFGQSKFIPILLTVLLLFLPLLTSCSRRSQYEDQLESIKDTRPEIPLEEQTRIVGARPKAAILAELA